MADNARRGTRPSRDRRADRILRRGDRDRSSSGREPRIAAAGLFAGSYVPRAILEEARRVTIPLHVLLQWDDEGNDRGMALELFDAFGSTEKTLYANMGGHTGVPRFAGDDAARFFARHLGSVDG